MSTVINDVKHSLRRLHRRPGFTAIALITLAVGIGANTVLFSVVNALVLRPMHLRQPNELMVCRSNDQFGWFPYSAFDAIRQDNPVFSDVASGTIIDHCTFTFDGVSRSGFTELVSSNYFPVLGVTPMLGRGFEPAEESPDAPLVCVLNHRLWQHLGSDRDILGKIATISGYPCQIVGVAPEGFSGPTLAGPDLWLPLGADFTFLPMHLKQRWIERGSPAELKYPRCLTLIGRIKAGMPLPTAEAHVRSLATHLAPLLPQDFIEKNKRWSLKPLPRLAMAAAKEEGAILPVICSLLMGVGVTVLAIACLNLANLYLIHGAYRHREIAIRAAIGSSRGRIVRELLIESLVLALAGGLLGLILAFWGMYILNTWFVVVPHLSHSLTFRLDVRVLGATLGFCLLATLLSGLWPALRLSQRNVMANLKELRGNVLQRGRKRRRMAPYGLSVAGQIALAVVLVMSAALFSHSALRAASLTPGYSFDGKIAVAVDLNTEGLDVAQYHQLYDRLIEHMRALPEVKTVGVSNRMHLGDGFSGNEVCLADPNTDGNDRGNRRLIDSRTAWVDTDYFQAVGLPLLQGRYFDMTDAIEEKDVVIIDQTLARRLRPDGNVLGCTLKGVYDDTRRIVGIVPGTRQHVLETHPWPHIYYPLDKPQTFNMILRIVDSMVGHEATLLKRLRREIHSVHPDIAVTSLGMLSNFHRGTLEMWTVRVLSGLALMFGIVSLFLATLGIYGVKGYTVATRTPEFGIRMALGATGGDIKTMVLRDGMILTLIGLGLGLALALAGAHIFGILFLRKILCDVNPIDSLSIVATIVFLGLASLAASYIPARRAASTDLMEALRYE